MHIVVVIELEEKLMPSMSLLKDALENKSSENKNVIETVVKNVKEVLKIAAPGGKCVLTSSNSIHPGCKPENVDAMLIML